ncbi:MAG: hydrogenase maturation nickel metallochaperone HypA [Gemmatimonadaceae bacterium]
MLLFIMHELSIAISLVEIAEEEAERLGGKVIAVHLKLGPMAGVVKDALLFSYEIACQETALEGSRLVIEDTPLIVFCPQCRTNRVLGSPQLLRCFECGTPTPEVVGGRELQMVAMEVEDAA